MSRDGGKKASKEAVEERCGSDTGDGREGRWREGGWTERERNGVGVCLCEHAHLYAHLYEYGCVRECVNKGHARRQKSRRVAKNGDGRGSGG